MSGLVRMKMLEATPARSDRGIAMLSGGRIAQVYGRIAAIAAAPGRRMRDIGCGTGAVSFACARHRAPAPTIRDTRLNLLGKLRRLNR